MQPSEYDIQREVEALRDIRRRSTTPGALALDPDLPHQSPPTSPTTGYWSGGPSPSLTDDDSSSAYGDGSSSDLSAGSPNNPTDDPFHLFWVPAGVHPEIAPAEFRAFLKEHARSPPPDGIVTPERSNSVASTSSALGRKKSMLSRQYRPSENDGIEDERVVPLRRNRSSVYSPQLTISDLQKLEELAEEASESDDPSKLRNILRRSLSLNVSPSDVGQVDDMSDMGDEADAPIIVPPPGQILRRAARTKIRKAGLPGDGGGHRFGATRRGTTARPAGAAPASTPEQRLSSDVSSSDHDDPVESGRPRTFSNGNLSRRPDSFSEEASIYDAYARDEDEDMHTPVLVTSPPPMTVDLPVSPPPPETQAPPALLEVLEALGPILHHPQPQRLLSPPISADRQELSRTPSPPEVSPTPSNEGYPPSQSPPSFLSTPPSPIYPRKDRDKKGLFGKWGGDKGGKKSAKEKERENRERAEKEKESGFFVSLFGSKKKQEDPPPTIGLQGGTSGREAAQALLGASKSSRSTVPSPSPQFSGVGNSYARYPIHVERAIYRLSHIKLANPRRPLYEQVLISNLMFWYLGVINKVQSPESPPPGTAAETGAAQANSLALEKEQKEKEQREREQQERAEKEQLEKERAEREREMEMRKKESPRRGSLTKTHPAGSPGGGRRAEMPVKGPQYEMQHRVMEQEYGGFNGPPSQSAPMGRTTSAPAAGGGGQQYQRIQQPPPQFPNQPNFVQPQPQPQIPGHFYYEGDLQTQPQQVLSLPQVSPPPQLSPQLSPPPPQLSLRSPPQQQRHLPPGAMAPMDKSTWLSQPPPSSRKHSSTSPPPLAVPSGGVPHRRSRSPPPPHIHNQQPLTPNRYNPNTVQDNSMMGSGSNRTPGRSLSATAAHIASPPPVNGKLRKGSSAHAAPPSSSGKRSTTSDGHQNGIGEEEDVPLAVWQQQQRR